MTADLALSTHVVPYDEFWASGVRAGMHCVVCREKFRGYRFGPSDMVISCDCPCMCHRHAADRDADGHLMARAA